MSVSTTVQVQIGDLLAHCTVEVVLDAPGSAIVPKEITTFCSKVTAAVINASNDARAEHAATIVRPPAIDNHEPAPLLEPLEAFVAESEVGKSPLDLEDAQTGNTIAIERQPRESPSALVVHDPSVNPQRRNAILNEKPEHRDDNSNRVRVQNNFEYYLKRRSRHDSMEPERNIPGAKRVKVEEGTTLDAVAMHNPIKEPKPSKKRKGKGKNKQKAWQKRLNLEEIAFQVPAGRPSYGYGHSGYAYADSYTPVQTYPATTYTAASYPVTTYAATTYQPVTYPATTYPTTTFPSAASYPEPAQSVASNPGSAYSAPSYPTSSHWAPTYARSSNSVPPYPQTLLSTQPTADLLPTWWEDI